MPLEVATVVEDGVEYSFAMEYHGPPITRELPRAVPINVDRIPVAAVVSPLPFSDNLALPVVQPISATDIVSKKLPKDLKFSSSSAELLTVSPTSVIAFESRNNEVSEGSYSKELGLGTETSVSPSSVNNALEEREPENCHSNDTCALSGELSSDFECCNRDGEVNGVNEREYSLPSEDRSCEFAAGVGNSGALGSLESFEKSREFSGSLQKSRLSSGCKESLDLNESNRTDWESNESVLSMDYLSSRVSSRKFGDGNHESGCEVRRAPVVTFCDIESDDENIDEDFSRSELEVVRAKKEPAVKVRKGA
ncbi:hypothetical protein CDL12_15054 [Handroanthus impetiginosus]|uniref:Uncharacterized protein n=1 Tax=Handroanthus impetiginosus TaxID=429701 RepID=A0A2G9H4A4_9LAMI|nr:hypothetical protein CDL12_15054 [Handroanthus impetiginosus]